MAVINPLELVKENAFNQEQIFEFPYYSSPQIYLFINGQWLDEITSLQYNKIQGKYPLYGYASREFSTIADGHIIVNGTFTINFKHPDYLTLLLAELQQQQSNTDPQLTRASNEEADRIIRDLNNKNNLENIIPSIIESILQNPQQAEKVRTNNQTLLEKRLKEAFWPNQDTNLNQTKSVQDFNNFDIYIRYGQTINGINVVNETITGCHITTNGKAITLNDDIIQESYTFVARNIK